jgi:hypothetical protein
MKTGPFVPAPQWPTPSDEVLLHRAKSFYETMQLRRTVRDFSDCSVPRKVIEDCIRAAGTAPNGANLQPWHFVAISGGTETSDSRRGRNRRKRILSKPRSQRMVRGARAVGHRFEQAVLGNGAVAHRGVRAAVSYFAGWRAVKDLLCDRISRNRHWSAGHRGAYLWLSRLTQQIRAVEARLKIKEVPVRSRLLELRRSTFERSIVDAGRAASGILQAVARLYVGGGTGSAMPRQQRAGA